MLINQDKLAAYALANLVKLLNYILVYIFHWCFPFFQFSMIIKSVATFPHFKKKQT